MYVTIGMKACKKLQKYALCIAKFRILKEGMEKYYLSTKWQKVDEPTNDLHENNEILKRGRKIKLIYHPRKNVWRLSECVSVTEWRSKRPIRN